VGKHPDDREAFSPTRILASMPPTDILIECANCGRPVRESEAEEAGWRFYSDGVGELLPFCALCTYREFRPDVPSE
jgi:hypothetical protein